MPDLIKTWPRFMEREKVDIIFSRCGSGSRAEFYFTLGRGKPRQEVGRLWFAHRGEVVGSFAVDRIIQNDGTLPKLRSISGEVSEWQIKPDAWVAVCRDYFPLNEAIYHESFRGWHYIEMLAYKQTMDAKVNLEQ